LEEKDIAWFMVRANVQGFTCQQIKGKFFPLIDKINVW